MEAAVDPVAHEQVGILLGLLAMAVIVIGLVLSLYFKLEGEHSEAKKRIKALEERGP